MAALAREPRDFRPIEASKAAVSYARETSTPDCRWLIVLSDKHLSADALAAFDSALEGDDDREFKSLLFFKVGRGDGEFLIEVPVDDKDWEQEMPEDVFNLLKYADARSCSWVLLGSERGVNQDLPTFTHAG